MTSCIILLLLCVSAWAQSILPNGDFEQEFVEKVYQTGQLLASHVRMVRPDEFLLQMRLRLRTTQELTNYDGWARVRAQGDGHGDRGEWSQPVKLTKQGESGLRLVPSPGTEKRYLRLPSRIPPRVARTHPSNVMRAARVPGCGSFNT